MATEVIDPEPRTGLKRAIAWRTLTEIARRHPALQLRLVETHPCDGQYDCLTMVRLPEYETVCTFNLAGTQIRLSFAGGQNRHRQREHPLIGVPRGRFQRGVGLAGDPALMDVDGSPSDIGAYGGPGAAYTDADGDGYPSDVDCDDADASGTGPVTVFADEDGDGYGSGAATSVCVEEAGYVNNNSDCDDGGEDVNPEGVETCNGRDDDCDGTVDAGLESTFYADSDEDGYGNAERSTEACSEPNGYVADASDCDDDDAAVWPGAPEVCGDGVDQDCAGGDSECGDTDEPDTDGDADSGAGTGEPAEPGCGCATQSTDGAPFVALVSLLLLRRRRRS